MTDAETLTSMLHGVDRLGWAEVRACFADRDLDRHASYIVTGFIAGAQ